MLKISDLGQFKGKIWVNLKNQPRKFIGNGMKRMKMMEKKEEEDEDDEEDEGIN